jgi:hypothetical protein
MNASESRFGDPAGGVLIGTAIGYGYAQVAPFLHSLRAAGYRGMVALSLADDLPASDRARFAAEGVTMHLVPPTPWISTSRSAAARVARGAARTLAPNSARLALTIQGPISRRWLVYPEMADAMRAELQDAPWVLLTDVRDVHFQADPTDAFDGFGDKAALHLFAEGWPGSDARDPAIADGATLIGQQHWNGDWVEYLGGPEVRAQLAACQVLCAGTILLRPATIPALADRMVSLMGHNRTRTAPTGVDQGAMNLLFHTGALDDLAPLMHPNATGGIFTMGTCPLDAWTSRDGVVTIDGVVPAVVHQYDRFPELVAAWQPS